MSGDDAKRDDAYARPIVAHLLELHSRLLRVVLGVLVVFLPFFACRNEVYTFVAAPLMSALPVGSQMIATAVASTFMTPFKLSAFAAVVVMVPYILHQLWSFIAPGLYPRATKLVVPLLVSSVLLLCLGGALAFFIVFPFVFVWFVGAAPEGVTVMTDISRYFEFALGMFLAFGATFEIPVAVVLLVRSGITTVESLQQKRSYVIVGCFVVAAILTPPDVVSQLMMAFPMWLLYEIGVLAARALSHSATAEEGVRARV